MTHYLDKEAYKDRMRRNGAHSRGGVSKERKAALARATEPDACRYCGAGLYQEEADIWGNVCDDCAEREGLTT